jgi:hypothetical protein
MADAKTDTINCLDPEDGTIIRQFKAPSNAPTGLTYDGRYLWVADRSTNEIYLMDPKREHIIGILKSPGPTPWGLTWDGTHLWNADYQERKIYQLNTTTDNPVIHLGAKKLSIEYVIHALAQGPDPIDTIDFYIAIPENRYNQEIIGESTFTPSPVSILTDQFKQTVAHFKKTRIKPGTHLRPRMQVDVVLHRTRFWIIPEKVKPLSTISQEIKRDYLKNTPKYRLKNPLIKKAVKKAVGNETNPYWMARNIYQFVLKTLDYKLAGGWDSVPLLLERGTGSCSEYSFVTIAL